MYEKILLAVDDSNDSFRAVKRTIDLQKLNGSEVVVFHSIDSSVSLPMNFPMISTSSGTIITPMQIERERRELGTRLLEKIKLLFRKHSVPIETRLVKDQPPEKYISKAIQEEGFDLVVVGCEGDHSKLKRIFSDTVPSKVLNQAPADLLVVR